MKNLVFGISLLAASQLVSAQNVLSSATMTGSVSAVTDTGHQVWTRGGSPRSGYYWYWRSVTLQHTSAAQPLAFNQSTGSVQAIGNYFSPEYRASGSAKVTFTNTPTSAEWSITSLMMTSPLPSLQAHEWANANTVVDPRFYFTVPNDTDVTITFRGIPPGSFNLYALSGEIGPSESGRDNTVTVTAGGSYCFWAKATKDADRAYEFGRFGVTITCTPAGG